MDIRPAGSKPSAPTFVSVYLNRASVPFWLVHFATLLGIVYYGWSWSGFAMALVFYYARMFFLTAGYHRYFAHRSYKTSRTFQFVLALMGQTFAQRGVLWWAAHHRTHHKYSDQPADIHSPVQGGFWHSHIGWFLGGEHKDTDLTKIADFAQYPELLWLNQRSVALLPPMILAILCGVVGGYHGLLWWFFVSTVIGWHGTFTINSLAHVWGRRRYPTTDDSRNNFALAILTMGEGWHNNHHHYQSSAAQGFFWWEIDISYYILRGLAAVGIVWDLRKPPATVYEPVALEESADPRRRAA